MKSNLRKLLDFAAGHSRKISVVSYIGGLIWFLALAHPSLNNKTYFSENALLPGMVDTGYEFHTFAKSLKVEVENTGKIYRDNFHSWLMDKMTAIGLETYEQNFTIHLPEEISTGDNLLQGTNVYGILRAPRVAQTEALVFSVPMKHEKEGPFYELVLLLSLAQHFRNNIYWAKDIIFLLVDHNEVGIEVWLSEYHGMKSRYIKSSPMLGRSGAIQAAINLELEVKDFTYMQILMESLNGQLPNLDIVNMVVRLCHSERIPVALTKMPFPHVNKAWDEYGRYLSTMVAMMLTQASGRPSAAHGLFPKYGIEAVTLRGRGNEQGGSSISFARLGRALEGMFRSLNNLLERFHQSFFFYLLPSPYRYVSIGLYMPPLGCLVIGPALLAVACWIKSADEKENDEGTSEDKRKEDSEPFSKQAEQAGEGVRAGKKDCSETGIHEELAFTQVPRHFGKVLRVVLAGHAVGFLIFTSPYTSRLITPTTYDFGASNLVAIALLASFVVGLTLMLFMSLSGWLTDGDVFLLKSIALVIYALSVGCLATVNFAFGFFLAIFSTPAFILVQSTKFRLRRFVQVAVLVLSSPLNVLFLFSLCYHVTVSGLSQDCLHLLYDSLVLCTDCILLSLRDWVLFGSWSYAVTTLVVLPNWLLFWFIAWT